MSIAQTYLRFARVEARDESAIYADWALGVAEDTALTRAISQLPLAKQQPNLIFAAARYHGAPEGAFAQFRDWTLTHWPQVRAEARHRRTQTNEPRRCAVLLPALAALPQPLALLEVGASAGLCLYPDQYSYKYNSAEALHPKTGPSEVLLECATTGPVPLPTELPRVVWRAGIDLNPLDVNSADDMRWLRTLIWPEQDDRRDRLNAAVAIARREPAHLIRGDVNESLANLAGQAPPDATLVIFHSAVIAYLDIAERELFATTVTRLPARWISNEAPSVFPSIQHSPPLSPNPDKALFLLSRDGMPLGYTAPHGQRLHYIPD